MFEPSTIILALISFFIFVVDGIGYSGGNQDIHRQAENSAGFYFCPARIFNGGFFSDVSNEAKFFHPSRFCRRYPHDYP